MTRDPFMPTGPAKVYLAGQYLGEVSPPPAPAYYADLAPWLWQIYRAADLESLPILADWLEERGDARSEKVRAVARLEVEEYNNGGTAYWWLKGQDGNTFLTPGRAKAEQLARAMELFP